MLTSRARHCRLRQLSSHLLATTAATTSPDGAFAADIEEEANSYFQKIYTSEQSIGEVSASF